ncbi:hypothetical protein H5410_023201 [Solanum commersonii]|uniref:Uncharacterized protein n=1 Tax=Solanum commersonii TaxID=4109 RepID=A0A9J5ZIY5_SOLCO|nr:hypothetical protein H5410_023201 [Solanum commersonii]
MKFASECSNLWIIQHIFESSVALTESEDIKDDVKACLLRLDKVGGLCGDKMQRRIQEGVTEFT